MPFQVTARMILELGAELIGSDGVAFYELIKNAFDAGSKHVEVDVIMRVSQDIHEELYGEATEAQAAGHREATSKAFKACRVNAIEAIEDSAPRIEEATEALEDADSWESLLEAIDNLNFIEFVDYGSGMSLKHLKDVYLVLGTRDRLKQKQEQAGKGPPVLGEKGIGRLSVMRLGERLSVRTTTDRDSYWNCLDINWRWFSHDSDELLEDIEIDPTRGRKKRSSDKSGTRILISGLRRNWRRRSLEEIASEDVSRFMDPFLRKSMFPISLRYNEEPVSIPRLDKILFEHAHAEVKVSFDCRGRELQLRGHVNYLLRRREHTFCLTDEDLTSVTNASIKSLKSLGGFSAHFYWFNRRILTAIEGIGDRKRVLSLVKDWSGGLMVFRDGFRVLPYGSADDDWLDLDRRALASPGYKVNRAQLIGKVEIGSIENPALTDQTNREGLRDCKQKRILQALLRHVLETQFRAFLNQADKEVQSRVDVTFDDIQERMSDAANRMSVGVKRLIRKHPDVKRDQTLVADLKESTKQIEALIHQTEDLADSFERGRSEMVHLAGIGAMVEFVAHELNRATERALDTLASRGLKRLPAKQQPLVDTLRSQLKTLQKRLRILDPLSTPGRQVKESFDLVEWVQEIVDAHDAQFERHRITVTVDTDPPGSALRVRMVKGMLVQILENLISNSVYWLRQRAKLRKRFAPCISIEVVVPARQIRFSDNGPGISPDRIDDVFQAFVTTKPPGHGKGLGLFIAREVASYHDASLYLSDDDVNSEGNLNTFVLDLKKGEA
ncbi:MAG: HAMP domain-containing histidine kinase [Pirellulales bacterium]|nr:HAMP domain-containing histidine kinase [Pirellulales bacterium]